MISAAFLAACLWVIASTITALLPMRLQYAPGLTLLITAPFILLWIGAAHGPWIAALCTLAVISPMRHPLLFLARKVLGR